MKKIKHNLKQRLGFDTWKQTDFIRQKARMAWGVTGVFLALLLLQWHSLNGIKDTLAHQRLYITPANVVSGGYYQVNQLPPEMVYSFAWQILIAMYTWPDNAVNDYKANIHNLGYYLTPDYYQALERDYNTNLESGNLLDASQSLSPASTQRFVHQQQVKQISDGVWQITMQVEVRRFKGGALLMDGIFAYRIRIVRTAASIQNNPWGLAIAGISQKKIKQIL